MFTKGDVVFQVACSDADALSRQPIVSDFFGGMSLSGMLIEMSPGGSLIVIDLFAVKILILECCFALFVHHLETCRDFSLPLGHQGPVGLRGNGRALVDLCWQGGRNG